MQSLGSSTASIGGPEFSSDEWLVIDEVLRNRGSHGPYKAAVAERIVDALPGLAGCEARIKNAVEVVMSGRRQYMQQCGLATLLGKALHDCMRYAAAPSAM